MDNLLHGTDTMTIISQPNQKYDTLVDHTFDPRNVDFRLAIISIKGVEHDQVIRDNNTCIYLAPGRLSYNQTTRRYTLKVNSPDPKSDMERIPNRTWKQSQIGHGKNFTMDQTPLSLSRYHLRLIGRIRYHTNRPRCLTLNLTMNLTIGISAKTKSTLCLTPLG